MSLQTEKFIATLKLTDDMGTATPYFRDFLAKVDRFIQSAAVVSIWGGVTGTLADQTDLQNALNTKVEGYTAPTVRDEATDPYTLVLGDADGVIRFTTANAAVTVPTNASVAIPAGTEISIRQAGTGTLVLTTTGLTINGSLPTWSQHTELKLRKVATDEWDVV